MLHIARRTKQIKTKTTSFRTTPDVDKLVNRLKNELKFETTTELLEFSLTLLDRIHEWQQLGYDFCISNNATHIQKINIEL